MLTVRRQYTRSAHASNRTQKKKRDFWSACIRVRVRFLFCAAVRWWFWHVMRCVAVKFAWMGRAIYKHLRSTFLFRTSRTMRRAWNESPCCALTSAGPTLFFFSGRGKWIDFKWFFISFLVVVKKHHLFNLGLQIGWFGWNGCVVEICVWFLHCYCAEGGRFGFACCEIVYGLYIWECLSI